MPSSYICKQPTQFILASLTSTLTFAGNALVGVSTGRSAAGAQTRKLTLLLPLKPKFFSAVYNQERLILETIYVLNQGD